MAHRKTFTEFIRNTGDSGSIRSADFELRTRDAYELYSYIWDTLRFRKGGIWNFWKRMPPQTIDEMADDWVEANPQWPHLRERLWNADLIRQLGFRVDERGIVSLPD